MIEIKYSNGQNEKYPGGEYPNISGRISEIYVPAGFQAVVYEKEQFTGNSAVMSAHDGEKTFMMSDTNLKQALSLRVLEGIKIVSGNKRDGKALEEALETDGWLQKSFAGTHKRMEWLLEAKFGCFVHWGIYAVAGGEWNGIRSGYAEHLQRVLKMTQEDYKKNFIDEFNPVKFDADEWISAVKEAGMKFFVITAKHHDGFAMYPSEAEAHPYDIRMSPFKRDPMAEPATLR
jgi:hypothetical protein